MNEPHAAGDGNVTERAHEPDVVSMRAVVLSAATLAVCVVLICVVTFGLIDWFEAQAGPRQPVRQRDMYMPAITEAWANPGEQLAEAQAEARARLDGYDWVDREQNVVRIPIDRAMRLMANETTEKGGEQ